MADKKVKGPASYFPSIEKKYGKPIEHWLELAKAKEGERHMETVNRLKADHGLGHSDSAGDRQPSRECFRFRL